MNDELVKVIREAYYKLNETDDDVIEAIAAAIVERFPHVAWPCVSSSGVHPDHADKYQKGGVCIDCGHRKDGGNNG
jgi:hypothetical protein